MVDAYVDFLKLEKSFDKDEFVRDYWSFARLIH
jgi:hypothetical protein